MAEKLGTKDFINIGIFTTLYFIVYFACGLLSFVPIPYTGTWMLVALVVMALVAGIIGAFLGRSVLKKYFQRAGIV